MMIKKLLAMSVMVAIGLIGCRLQQVVEGRRGCEFSACEGSGRP